MFSKTDFILINSVRIMFNGNKWYVKLIIWYVYYVQVYILCIVIIRTHFCSVTKFIIAKNVTFKRTIPHEGFITGTAGVLEIFEYFMCVRHKQVQLLKREP